MITGIIYKVTNLITGKVYIGQTIKTAEIRFKDHVTRRNDGSYFHNSIKKYGKENFKVETICRVKNLDLMERFFIALNNSVYPNGYNLTYGGQGCGPELQQTRDKIGKKQLGRISPLKGVKRGPNPELSKKLKGIPVPHLQTPEAVEKRRKTATGKKRTDAFKQNCSKIYTGRWNLALAKPVLIKHKDTGVEVCFRSVCEASRAGYPRSALSNFLTGRSKSMRQYHAEYIKMENK